jgi:TonB family protein
VKINSINLMSFSSIAIGQREKEVKALKTFLVGSTVSSLVLHIVVLASGIGDLFLRTPELEDEKPIELTLVEPEIKETPIIEEKKPLPEDNKLGTSEVATSGGSSLSPQKTSPQTSPQIQSQQKVAIQSPPKVSAPIPQNAEKSVTPEKSTPVQKPVENTKRESNNPIQPQKDDPVTSKEPQKPVNNTPVTSKEPQQPVNNTPVQSANNQESSNNLRGLLSQFRDSRTTQTVSGNASSETASTGTGNGNGTAKGVGFGSGTGTGNGVGFGSGTGTGNGVGFGSGTGNGTGNAERRRREIAVAPTEPKIPTQKPENNGGSDGSADGRAACSDCKVKYSDGARRRKAEGRVQVAVDTDKDGNVTRVRLAASSGDRQLDEEHLQQARSWKLKPSESGRQGVNIATEYSIQGSRRNRQVRERQQQREERERQRQVATASSNSDETPRRKRRNIESSTETATSNEESRSSRLNQRLRRRTEVNPSRNENETQQPRRRVRNSEEGSGSVSNRLRRQRSENTASEVTPRRRAQVTSENYQGSQQAPTRRKRREFNRSNQSSDSGSRLRNVLRRSRESAPATSTGKEGE